MPIFAMIAAPLASAVVLALMAGRADKRLVGTLACLAVLASLVGAVTNSLPLIVDAFPALASGEATVSLEQTAGGAPFHAQHLYTWFSVGSFGVDIAFKLDALAALMALVVTGVGFLIHLYAAGYMSDDPDYGRFFCYMNLFVASMLVLVLADNLLLLYLGWEGVGICSYLLIGFWYKDPANGAAARKAFIVTRIGDMSLLLGLLLLAVRLETLNIDALVDRAVATWTVGHPAVTLAATLLLIGAIGKSAQVPLQVWLPDAMAGPTPVSALLHAATMVTAGVYLIARTHAIFLMAPAVLATVAGIGALTAFLAACSALVQNDIKRVLAYSTVSQIGYMFAALGVAGFAAAMFHFMTHAFFKALLFLSAGNVSHGTDGETDLRRLGGLRRSRGQPGTAALAAVGAGSLAGLPLITSGFYSKDAVLWATLQPPFARWGLLVLLLVTAGLTSLYAFRWYFMIFAGEPGPASQGKHHRPRDLMLYPLVGLAAGSLLVGFLEMPETLGGYHAVSNFLGPVFAAAEQRHGLAAQAAFSSVGAAHQAEVTLQSVSAALSLLGMMMAYHWFVLRPTWVRGIAESDIGRGLGHLWRSGWGADVAYGVLIVRPYRAIARWIRHEPVDDIAGWITGSLRAFHYVLSLTESGRLRSYAAGMVLGAVLLLAIWLWS